MTILNAAPGQLAATIKAAAAGDTVIVLPGDHGPLSLYGVDKGGRVMIVGRPSAAIGATMISSCANLLFRDCAFRGLSPIPQATNFLVQADSKSGKIGFDRCTFAAQDDVSGWTPEDWRDKPYGVALALRGADQSVSNSRFFNCRSCLDLWGDRVQVTGNLFEAFGVDAIAFGHGGSWQTITGNTIRDGRHTTADPLHADAMQGYPAPKADAFSSHITIADNVIEASPLADYLQGISAFDGRWQAIKVQRNFVVTSAWHGITFFGADGITIEGNTVVQERPGPVVPWIQVTKAKDGRCSTGVVVRDNVAPQVLVDPA